MNFSIYRKLSKTLSLTLALVMVLSLFAGCKKEEPNVETTPSETSGLNINLTDTTLPAETQEPTETVGNSDNMATVLSRINVRSKPSIDNTSKIIYTLEAGARIEITYQQYVYGYDWGYTPSVENGGWVVMDFVEMDNKELAPSGGSDEATDPADDTSTSTGTATKLRMTVNATELKIRSEPSQDGKILGTYDKGEKVIVTETKDGWGKTDKGWVSMTYLTPTSTSGDDTSTNTNTGSNSNNDSNTNTGTSATTVQSNGSTKVISKGIVTAGELNIRSKPNSSSDKVGTYKYGARVEIMETSGNWGRTSKGWIHTNYIYKDGTTGKYSDTGTVTGNELSIRSGPGTDYTSLGHYNSGDRVTILEQFKYGNTTWGCTNKGWISLTYVDLDNSSTDDDNSTNSYERTGWITAEELNIREGAGTNYDTTGSTYLKGEKVTILETKGSWGRTDKGWISINFVDFNSAPSSSSDTNTNRTAHITATELRIRDGAGTGYDVVGSYEYGDEVIIIETKDNWGRTKLGWISLNFVDFD